MAFTHCSNVSYKNDVTGNKYIMYKDQDYYPAFITTKLITLLYLRVGIFFYSRVDDRNNSPKGVVLTPKTRSNSNPPLFIEVSVPSHESERTCICHRGSQLYFHIARYMLKEKGGHFFATHSESRISAPFFASKTV